MSGLSTRTASHMLLLALALLAAFLAYLPGLHGDFVLDDFSNIVNNFDIHVGITSDWLAAAQALPSPHPGRWLAALSFAANHYFSGLNPFAFKLTNLAIHLFNGALVYFLLRLLLAACTERRAQPALENAVAIPALLIAACWMLAPINVSAVLYAVQRMEVLSHTFVFLGLITYLRCRTRLVLHGKGVSGMATSLIFFTALGFTVKESAVLLPVYAACIEMVLWKNLPSSAARRSILVLFASVLVLPAVIGLYWLSTWITPDTGTLKEFGTYERLVTQARVLCGYIGGILIPVTGKFSLFHDDYQGSTSLLQPATTLLSAVAIGLLLALALWLRSSRPVLALGIIWFFAGHALTATIIPLELVFEHRNYFASLGLILAVFYTVFCELIERGQGKPAVVLGVLAFLWSGGVTTMRAMEWGDPVKFAIAEATRHPQSPRALLEKARVWLRISNAEPGHPLTTQAVDDLLACMPLARSGLACETGLLVSNGSTESARAMALKSLHSKVSRESLSAADAMNLELLLDCATRPDCRVDNDELHQPMTASVAHSQVIAPVAFVYGLYAATVLGDYQSAEDWLRGAIEKDPSMAHARIYLIRLLLSQRQPESAQQELDQLTAQMLLSERATVLEQLQREVVESRLDADL